ncbi:hypothetical protein A3K86_19570 [Photobacterium jeanii]|uniref:Uncharacterized protein n=1 Tax=Photobacterium jeanii TaxID=858640 RepID=A0A178K362_9GAMM|nr:hypothetical protein [Photobacterium jeanii]OAN11163.1 hypothetical protein A3K86_19570 [Photobacterium jeanii]PST90682.1 hypothetical protein C9I91_08670 [Photobacterium jeanii]
MSLLQQQAFDHAILYLSSGDALSWSVQQRDDFIAQLKLYQAPDESKSVSLALLQATLKRFNPEIEFSAMFAAGEQPLCADRDDLSLLLFAAVALYEE